jgi:YHS domain-containing protein
MHTFRLSTSWRSLVVTSALLLVVGADLLAQKVNQSWTGVGAKGYDVVAYFTDQQPVKGNPRFEHVHGDVTYRFASTSHRDAFAKEPARYLPQFGGFCAWAVSRNYTADVDPTAWRIVDGKLYLNYNASVQAKWAEDVNGNIAKGQANWPLLSRK